MQDSVTHIVAQPGSALSSNMKSCVIRVRECLVNLGWSCFGVWEAVYIEFCDVSSSGMTFVHMYSVSLKILSHFNEFILSCISDISIMYIPV
jgi:hypothetical protein